MRNILPLIILSFGISIFCADVKAQKCRTDEYHAQLIERNPEYRKHLESMRMKIEEMNGDEARLIPCDGTNTFVVPVAVHFSAAFTCENTQCLIDATNAQIQSLNDDFAAMNADLNLFTNDIVGCGAPNVASDGACLTFCLATQNHPVGSGIPEGSPAITIGEYSGTTGSGGSGTGGDWPGILNIHVITGFGGGVSDGIGGDWSGTGVAVDGGVFGGPNFGPCTSGATLDDGGGVGWDLGRTLTHEVGHYLGLWHTFQGGCGGEPTTPFAVTDTPEQSTSSSGCPGSTNCAALATGCTTGEFLQFNYMDYFDDPCLVMFSNEQAIGMNMYVEANIANGNIRQDATVCSAITMSPAACSVTANFSPANGTNIVVCTDDGNTFDLIDESSSDAISWSWTYTITSGDIVLDATTSNMQNPSPAIVSGTSGSIDVSLEVCDAAADCVTLTQSYTLEVLSGDACPNTCDFTLNLTDDFGDGWNGATVEIFDNGVSVGVFGGSFTAGSADGPYTVALTDGATISIDQTNGGFPGEEGYTLTDPFGNIVATLTDGTPLNNTFIASCTMPTCDDNIQNGAEAGVDCGGPDCLPCPLCPVGFIELINENFDNCTLPTGWSTTHTSTGNTLGTCNDGTSGFSFDCTDGFPDSAGGGPNAGFSGCQAIFNDDNLGSGTVGIGCIIMPIVDLTSCPSATLRFDWQNEDAGGGTLNVNVDGVNVFTTSGDGNGSESGIALTVGGSSTIEFCYDDDGSFAWGMAIDNVAVCCESAVEYCDNICYAEYEANPGPTDVVNTLLCVTPLGCADNPDASCLSTMACDDNDPCTENDIGTFITATDEECSCAGTAVATCTLPTVMQSCDDNDPCTENDMEEVDACDANVVCVPCAGTPIATCTLPTVIQSCDDNDPCTENDMEEVDACDANVVCVPCAGTPIATCTLPTVMQSCDDNDPCTENDMEEVDACDTNVVCVPCAGTPAGIDCNAATPRACDDGNACTENDMEMVVMSACTGMDEICVPCAGTPIVGCTSCDADHGTISVKSIEKGN